MNDEPMPIADFLALPENAHLRDDAPYVKCSACGRKSWGGNVAGSVCGMTQPNGTTCVGIFSLPIPADAYTQSRTGT